MQKKRILVLQLARLGDIYQSWPVLRAIKRSEPDCELHLATRERFAGAAPQDGVVDRHWKLGTRDILMPLIEEIPDHEASLAKLGEFVDEIAGMNFDRVINLSFSPLSSYLVSEIAGPDCDVRGYTRTADGFLAIPDDGSAYFYAQAGVGKSNRIHIVDLFAHVAGVELAKEDWSASVDARAIVSENVTGAGTGAIVVHIGASQLAKTLSWSKWLQVLKGLCRDHEGPVVLVGSEEERPLAERACAFGGVKQPINLVGRTSLTELVEIIRAAKCVIGGDSAPIQIASLTNTPCLNLSFPQVSFWETGPRASGSRILPLKTEDDVASERIVDEALRIVRGKGPSSNDVIRVVDRLMPYVETIPQPNLFQWEMLKSIYMSEAFPAPPNETFIAGIHRLTDVNALALEQLEALRRVPNNKTAAAILDRCDEIMNQIVSFVPELVPLIHWFQTERLRIGPMPVSELVNATTSVHVRLAEVLQLYTQTDGGPQNHEGNANDDVVLE